MAQSQPFIESRFMQELKEGLLSGFGAMNLSTKKIRGSFDKVFLGGA
jgi:hypothetical protein